MSTNPMQPVDLDKAVGLLDEVLPSLLLMADMEDHESLEYLSSIFEKESKQRISHLQDQWHTKEGEFGSFYLNLDAGLQETLLEHFGVTIHPTKYTTYHERFLAQLDGKNEFDIFPFQTHVLYRFLLMANNNSLDTVENLPSGKLLMNLLKDSQIDYYGTGVNWSRFYVSLEMQAIPERKEIIEHAISDHKLSP